MLRDRFNDINESMNSLRLDKGRTPKEAYKLLEKYPSKFMLSIINPRDKDKQEVFFIRYTGGNNIEQRSFGTNDRIDWNWSTTYVPLLSFYEKEYLCYVSVPKNIINYGKIYQVFNNIATIKIEDLYKWKLD